MHSKHVSKARRAEMGFTLIEVLVALSIAAVAMVALMGRLGASADIQYTLTTQSVMLDAAMDLLVKPDINTSNAVEETQGDIQVAGEVLHWRCWYEKTMFPDFVRKNIAVTIKNEPELVLFIYHKRGA